MPDSNVAATTACALPAINFQFEQLDMGFCAPSTWSLAPVRAVARQYCVYLTQQKPYLGPWRPHTPPRCES